jgi:carboxyl-terminal processing protease
VIVKPIEESPADRAGIAPGDLVTHIDGVSVEGMTVEDAVGKVRGPKGTTVVLTILRGEEPARDVSIVRDVIVEKEVVSRTLADGAVGYIRLTGFSETGADEVKAALKADIDAGRRKFILDLRGNPGGFVTAARTVASQFIAEGPIFWQEDAEGVQVPTNAETGGLATDSSVRLVVLIDGGSASAAEIVAGALQDTGRATLVGDDSFGKGTVQEWQPLPDDTGGFRLTVAKWLTPNKRWIHESGLAPDVRADAGPAAEIGAEDPSVVKALEVLGETAAIPVARAA